MSRRPIVPMSLRPLVLLLLLAFPLADRASGAQELAEVGIPVAEFAERRQALIDELGAVAPVVILGAEPPAEDYLRFRQRNDFLYLTGIDQPGAVLLIEPPPADDPDAAPRAVVFLPPQDPFAERWSGPQIVPGAETVERFGLGEALPVDQFEPRLLAALGLDTEDDQEDADDDQEDEDAEDADEGEEAAEEDADEDQADAASPVLLTHMPRGRDGEHSLEGRFAARLQELAPGVRLREVSGAIGGLRLVKSEAEVAVMQRAIDITEEAHRDVALVVRPGAFEYEAQGALEYAFTRNGAQRPAFASIVGSGPNSVILHYNANRRPMADGDLVVIDIGAEFDGYAADITRTFPVSGRFTDRQREVYQLVLDAQRAAELAFEPGKSSITDLHRAAVACMRQSPLRDSEGRTLDRSFVHGLGHWLGMDVHDVGGGTNRPIPSGAVFTIEPGIYLADESLGVRIEDDYLATDDGLVKLSGSLPSEPDEVEAMMDPDTDALE